MWKESLGTEPTYPTRVQPDYSKKNPGTLIDTDALFDSLFHVSDVPVATSRQDHEAGQGLGNDHWGTARETEPWA